MKLTFLPHSSHLPKRGYRLVLAAALFVAVAMVGVFSHASVAHAGGCPPSVSQVIRNVNSLDWLDVQGASLQPGAPVIQYPPDNGGLGALNQEWIAIPVPGSVAVLIQNVKSGLVLDVQGGSVNPRAPVIQ